MGFDGNVFVFYVILNTFNNHGIGVILLVL